MQFGNLLGIGGLSVLELPWRDVFRVSGFVKLCNLCGGQISGGRWADEVLTVPQRKLLRLFGSIDHFSLPAWRLFSCGGERLFAVCGRDVNLSLRDSFVRQLRSWLLSAA